MKWKINSLEEINRVAADFLEYVGDRTIFALYGPMGVGKTTFVKAVGECLGVEDDVNSPTFAIVNEYVARTGESVYHFDFYRVNDISEALDFGYEEYFYGGDRCFVEWPEKVGEWLPEGTVNCVFSENEDGSRELRVEME
ncbi:MAG: tRNA (adenosine(37)-N6)-threonylcarbamoyltransferase complex ATPase subunit type 1 TsaE [Odoribacter sp.]|nr:tRNA (adenosine(37)-N6)-threonylcarbamoyltransferase complex ATPase subunit type 1 TsaE [Odoribacter sp.]